MVWSSLFDPLPVWLGIGSKINDFQINLLQVLEKLGVPYGIRTRVAAVKGRCPRPLDERDKRLMRLPTRKTS